MIFGTEPKAGSALVAVAMEAADKDLRKVRRFNVFKLLLDVARIVVGLRLFGLGGREIVS